VGETLSAPGRTGTAHIKLDVPDYRDERLQVSPLVLGFHGELIDTAIGLDQLRVLQPGHSSGAIRRSLRGRRYRRRFAARVSTTSI